MDQLKRRLKRGLWFALAVIFLVESWLWDHLRDGLRALGRMLGVERFEPWLRSAIAPLSPQVTLAIFIIPVLAILPFKVVALALIADGYFVGGLIAAFGAKVFALGVTSFLFDICRDKLLQMPRFARFYEMMINFGAWAHALIEPIKIRVQEMKAELRALIASLTGAQGGQGRRLIARLRALARPKRSV